MGAGSSDAVGSGSRGGMVSRAVPGSGSTAAPVSVLVAGAVSGGSDVRDGRADEGGRADRLLSRVREGAAEVRRPGSR
ncbi:hypothetical protein OUY22_20415, partial [Nonomuraea sp. MCN248]